MAVFWRSRAMRLDWFPYTARSARSRSWNVPCHLIHYACPCSCLVLLVLVHFISSPFNSEEKKTLQKNFWEKKLSISTNKLTLDQKTNTHELVVVVVVWFPQRASNHGDRVETGGAPKQVQRSAIPLEKHRVTRTRPAPSRGAGRPYQSHGPLLWLCSNEDTLSFTWELHKGHIQQFNFIFSSSRIGWLCFHMLILGTVKKKKNTKVHSSICRCCRWLSMWNLCLNALCK